MKKCSKCGKVAPDEKFVTKGNVCKACKSALNKRWNDTHPQEVTEAKKRWDDAHPGRKAELNKRWDDSHPGRKVELHKRWHKAHLQERAEYNKRWSKAHPEKVAERKKRFREAHLERLVERYKRWLEAHPEKRREYNNARRARKAGNGGKFTAQEWKDLCAFYSNKCLRCGRDDVKLTADHVIPLKLGGVNMIDNIQPLCKSCNSKKGTKIIDYRIGYNSLEAEK